MLCSIYKSTDQKLPAKSAYFCLAQLSSVSYHVWQYQSCCSFRIVMQCGVSPAKLIPLLAAAQRRVQPVRFRSWRPRDRSQYTKACLSSCSTGTYAVLDTRCKPCCTSQSPVELQFSNKIVSLQCHKQHLVSIEMPSRQRLPKTQPHPSQQCANYVCWASTQIFLEPLLSCNGIFQRQLQN